LLDADSFVKCFQASVKVCHSQWTSGIAIVNRSEILECHQISKSSVPVEIEECVSEVRLKISISGGDLGLQAYGRFEQAIRDCYSNDSTDDVETDLRIPAEKWRLMNAV